MTIRPIREERMSAIWIFLCAYGPVILTVAGGVFLALGGAL